MATRQGTFDGQGHTVSNVHIDGTGHGSFGGFQGFISAIGLHGVVRNLGITGDAYGRVVGGIVGRAAIAGDPTSVAVDEAPLIENCWTDVDISTNGSSTRGAGGIFGGEDHGIDGTTCNIVNCYAKGDITKAGGSPQTGSISGPTNGSVSGCYYVGSNKGTYTGAITSDVMLPSASASFIGYWGTNLTLSGSDANGNFYRYRDASTGENGNPAAVTEGFSSADDLKAAATTPGDVYVADDANANDGYPLLWWQVTGASLDKTDIAQAIRSRGWGSASWRGTSRTYRRRTRRRSRSRWPMS